MKSKFVSSAWLSLLFMLMLSCPPSVVMAQVDQMDVPQDAQELLEKKNFSPQEIEALKQAIAKSQKGTKPLSRGSKQLKNGLPSQLNDQSGDEGLEAAGTPLQPGPQTKPPKAQTGAAAKPQASAEPSPIELLYRQSYVTRFAQNLTQYGYDLFQKAVSKPTDLAVPDLNYILGPGDEIHIRAWGSGTDVEFRGPVSRDGSVDVPVLGVMSIGGMTLGQAQDAVKREADKYIKGVNISVVLQRLRSLEVYVVGEVVQPGLNVVPAFSTVLGSLITSGGVKKSGSLRAITLYRDGKAVQQTDLYDLLLKGRGTSEAMLQNGDIIFVPRIGPTAAVAGAAAQPGIYEIRHEKNAAELVRLAGGELPQSFAGRIYLRRFENNKEFVVKDLDTARNRSDTASVRIQNGDLLELQYVETSRPSVVYLQGHVLAEDIFNFKPGLKLSDVLTSPDLLKEGAITQFALLNRYNRRTTEYETQSFPLKDVFEKHHDLALEPYDKIVILSKDEYSIAETVTIGGAVWRTGQVDYTPGLTLKTALDQSGGLMFGADPANIIVSRKMFKDGVADTDHLSVPISQAAGVVLQPNDYVTVPEIKNATTVKIVAVTGQVKRPGSYAIRENEHLSDVIERAGGFLDDAYYYGAKFTSPKVQKMQQESLDKLMRELELKAQQVIAEQGQTAASPEDAAAAKEAATGIKGLVDRLKLTKAEGRVAITLTDLRTFKGSPYDFVLDGGDRLEVPKVPNYVAVNGSVYSPNAYLFMPNQTVETYLKKSGGPTKTSDDDHIYVLKANGEVTSKDQGGTFSNRFMEQKLMPGDTVVVPENLERVPTMRYVRDIADIVFKIATTAGVAVAILK